MIYDKQRLEELNKARANWEENTLGPTLERFPERQKAFITTSSEKIERLYTPLDLPDWDYRRDLGFPGEYPYTRGVHATMHRGRLWTMRMFAGFGTAEETNQRFKYLLQQGQTGLSVAFDLPTLMGYDTDAPEALGEFGKCGVAVSSLKDMEILLDGIPLDKVTTSMTINSPAAVTWAMYIVAAEKQGIPMNELGGTIQNDILKEYIAQKEYIFPPEPSMRLVTDTIEYGSEHLPRWNTISISGYHIREAGSTAAQELAFTLADGLEYVRWALDRGLDIDDFAPRLSFFFNAHNDFFEEIAKYRAARRIWAREMKQTFKAKDPRSWKLRFHTQTAGCSLTAQQPEINIVRVAIQALAAVLGGTQSLHTNSFDEAIALPTDFSSRIARNTQLILQNETGVTNVVDPLAGSYYVEKLTADLADEAWKIICEVDEMGGMTKAVASGMPKLRIEEAAARRQAAVDRGDDVIVGVNKFRLEVEDQIDILDVDNVAVRESQVARLADIRAKRDQAAVDASLAALEVAAQSGKGNLLEIAIEAARARATVGEISMAMEKTFGRHRAEVKTLAGVYGAAYEGDEGFAAIQKSVEDFAIKEGRRPRMLVVKMGQDGHDRGAKVIATAFADIGFDVDVGPLFQTPEEAAQDAVDNDVHVVGISSQAAGHKTLAPKLVEALKAAGAEDIIVICGGVIPKQDYDFLYENGVKAIFGPGTNIPEAAQDILRIIREAKASE